MTVLSSNWKALKALPDQVKEMILNATDSERIDVLAEVREIEKKLASERQLAMSEINKGDEGDEWYIKQGRKCERSFNDSMLLLKIADALDVSPIEAIGYLLNRSILSLDWNWQPRGKPGLKALIRELELECLVVQKEVIAGDKADIGENWVDGYASFALLRERKSTDHVD